MASLRHAWPAIRGALGEARALLADLHRYPQQSIGPAPAGDYWEGAMAPEMGRLSPEQLHRADLIAGQIRRGATVLGLGCGDGALLRRLVERREVKAFGIDRSSRAARHARALGIDVEVGDLTASLPPQLDRVYDYVVLSEIIEHLPDPEALLLRLRGRAREAVIVTVISTGWWAHRLRLLLGRAPLQWAGHPAEHLRFWTLADFRWWARALGYRVAAVLPYAGPVGLRHVLPGVFARGFVFVLKPS